MAFHSLFNTTSIALFYKIFRDYLNKGFHNYPYPNTNFRYYYVMNYQALFTLGIDIPTIFFNLETTNNLYYYITYPYSHFLLYESF